MTPPAWLRDLGGADPYQLLGITGDATAEEITRAYRRRIRELHPDRESGDAEQARLVNLARDTLLDPVRRTDYDRLAAEPQPTPRSAWDTADVVIGAEPAPSAAWETEDVVLGAEPPLSADPPSVRPAQPYQPYHYPPSGYHQAYPSYPVAPQPSLGLPIAALVCAFFCVPLGLILGIAALLQHRHVPGTGRALAIAATVLSGAMLVVACLCYGGAFLSSLETSST